MTTAARVAEPVTAITPRPFRTIVFTQLWARLSFLHWAVDPADVAPLLPPGVHPDVLDGVSYVGLVPFHMSAGLLRGPAVPYLGRFPETNVRLYSVDDAGRRGVVFRSLEATRLLTVLGARALGVPYTWAAMNISSADGVFDHRSRRRWPAPIGASSQVIVRVGEQITEPSELEQFVTARWGLHLQAYGRTWYWPNQHPRWRLHSAELLACDENLIVAAGLPARTSPPASVVWSPGVRAEFGVPFRIH